MITFESMTTLSVTSCDSDNPLIGQQVGEISNGIQPTYGMLAEDMNVKYIVITFTWSD